MLVRTLKNSKAAIKKQFREYSFIRSVSRSLTEAQFSVHRTRILTGRTQMVPVGQSSYKLIMKD
jgi:hypothetical protein